MYCLSDTSFYLFIKTPHLSHSLIIWCCYTVIEFGIDMQTLGARRGFVTPLSTQVGIDGFSPGECRRGRQGGQDAQRVPR